MLCLAFSLSLFAQMHCRSFAYSSILTAWLNVALVHSQIEQALEAGATREQQARLFVSNMQSRLERATRLMCATRHPTKHIDMIPGTMGLCERAGHFSGIKMLACVCRASKDESLAVATERLAKTLEALRQAELDRNTMAEESAAARAAQVTVRFLGPWRTTSIALARVE